MSDQTTSSAVCSLCPCTEYGVNEYKSIKQCLYCFHPEEVHSRSLNTPLRQSRSLRLSNTLRSNVRSPGVQKASKRAHIMREILTTERSYVESLNDLVQVNKRSYHMPQVNLHQILIILLSIIEHQ
jgi:hypothetical protein